MYGIDGFHSIFSLGNWRALYHHAPCWLVNIHTSRWKKELHWLTQNLSLAIPLLRGFTYSYVL